MDPIVISAIIAIGGYALQNLWIKSREREKREHRLKRKVYEGLIKKIAHGVHIVLTRKESTTLDFKEQLDEVTNTLWLYASDDVLRALKAYLSLPGKTEELRNLILAMRKDLKIETNLSPSEIEWFRAT